MFHRIWLMAKHFTRFIPIQSLDKIFAKIRFSCVYHIITILSHLNGIVVDSVFFLSIRVQLYLKKINIYL